MNLSEFEKRFVDRFQQEIGTDFLIDRNKFGLLFLSKESPCEQFGSLNIFPEEAMITISCKITHTHCYPWEHKSDDPQAGMIEEALQKISDIVNGRIIVNEMRSPQGELICSGWRYAEQKYEDNPEFDHHLEKQYGGSPLKTEWTWSGLVKT